METLSLVIDLNTAEVGYSIRSIKIDLPEHDRKFSFLNFVMLARTEVRTFLFEETTTNAS